MKQQVLASSILVALYATTSVAQTADQTEDKKKTLDTVTVTGSLIPQAQVETASPTITITAQDISRQGFATIYDALKASPVANGGVQGNQSSGGFTQGAQTISLFGLPPNYTLILINGKPMTNYPLAYNGSNAFTDLANIPTAMVDHIDIVPGGNSAIYGSAAIAGVVNIVLKDKYSGFDVDYRYGDYTSGGGQNSRLQFSGGGTWGNLDAMFSLEFENQKPIFAADRKETRDLASNPSLNGAAPIPSRSFLILDGLTGKYIDPGAATCAPLTYLFGGTTSYASRPVPSNPSESEYYCGTTGQYRATSLLNRNRSASAYTNLTYHLNETTELYAQILFSRSAPQYNIGGAFQFWQSNENPLASNSGYFWNGPANDLQEWQHILAPEEYGGNTGAGAETVYTRNLNAAAGIRGTFGSDWNYDAYYVRSQTNTDDTYRHFIKSAVDNYYLGPQMGTYYGYPVYSPDKNKLYKPLTPAIFDSLTAKINNPSVAFTQSLNFTVTDGSLFHLPAGDVGIAATVTAGHDDLHNSLPELIASGDALGLTGSEAAGHRSNYGGAIELRAPITSMLTADVSGRYDNYSFAGTDAGKFTYKAGLELRPIDTLLFRGNYATAFRAPDLVNVFGSSGFYTSDVDYYLCRQKGFGPGTYQNCPNNTEFFGNNGSSSNLDDITAKTWTYGAVYNPIDRLTLTADYQRVEIKNEVTQLSVDQLLQDEADCLLGMTVGGQAIDPNSPSCQLYKSLVGRSPLTAKANPGGILTVTTYPINASSEKEDGVLASANYSFDMGHWGSLAFDVHYYIEFEHLFQQFPGDPVINVYHDPRFTDWKSTVNSSVTWNIDKWSTTVFNQRYGTIPDAAQTGRLPSWSLWNASVKYSFDSGAAVQVTSNNVFNKKPPVDKSASNFPYYNTYNYNAYGRAVWVEFAYRWGGTKE